MQAPRLAARVRCLPALPRPAFPPARSASTLPPPSPASTYETKWREFQSRRLREALNDRFLLVRKTQRDGLKRILAVCVLFVALKFVRTRVVGKEDGGKAF